MLYGHLLIYNASLTVGYSQALPSCLVLSLTVLDPRAGSFKDSVTERRRW